MSNPFHKLLKCAASMLRHEKKGSEELPPNIPPAAELKFKEVMAEAARLDPVLTAKVETLEQKLVATFGIPVNHQTTDTPFNVSCKPAWLGTKPEHLVLYSSELPPLTLLRQRAINLLHLQMQSECAQANGWVIFAQDPTPGRAREIYLKHGFATATKELVRAGHDGEMVRADQQALIGNMTCALLNLVQFLMISHRLARELPGLMADELIIPAELVRSTGTPGPADEFGGLVPEKIARRWRILQHACALIHDGLAGTRIADEAFPNDGIRDEAVRIADYGRQAIGTMKPGDEFTITDQVMRMARLQDFFALLKLQVDLEKVRNAPVADATPPETVSTPEAAEVWLKYLADAEAELVRAGGRVGSKAISGIKSLSPGRHIILQGRKGQAALAGFFTQNSEIARELPFIEKRLNGRCYESQLIEPDSGKKYWMLLTKFKPLKGYSMEDRLSVGIYLTEQVDALDESCAHN